MPLDYNTPIEPTPAASPAPVVNLPKKLEPAVTPSATTQVKQNLDRLQTLHHKLHALLEELNQLKKK